MDENFADDALSLALQSRRIPHGHARSKKGKGGSSRRGPTNSSFDPLRARGRYEVTLGSGKKKSTGSEGPSESWFEMHELTPGRDGLVGTFSFIARGSREEGMCLLAGSRMGLAKIVGELDSAGEEEDGEDEAHGEDDQEAGHYDVAAESDEVRDNGSAEPSSDAPDTEDDMLNHTVSSFEKNTFRSPKFWMTWRRTSSSSSLEPLKQSTEKRTAYLVFSGVDCQRFEGTISSSLQEWNNLKVHGRKVHSRASPCPLRWCDLPFKVEDHD
jgi:hypothetical protein